jgi:hypothetical protein
MMAITTAVLSAIAAFVGSWLAARFALDRFRHEKIWERRAAAYTAVFDALHDQAKWFATHADALERGRDIPDDEREKLAKEALEAAAAIRRRVDAETWLVSDAFLERIAKLADDLKVRFDDWPSYVEEGEIAIEAAIDDLRKIARRELRIPPDIIR